MTALRAQWKQAAGRLPGASLLLSLFAAGLWFSPELSMWCEWKRSEPWQARRWLTGHFTHWSVEHLAWDVIVFLILGAMVERRGRGRFLGCVVISGLAISAGVALFVPGIQSYRGLSGLDSALFGWLIVDLLRAAWARGETRKTWCVAFFAVAFVVKLVVECVTSSTLFVSSAESGFVPVPLAHGLGALAGACASLVSMRGCRLRRSERSAGPTRGGFPAGGRAAGCGLS